MSQDDKTVKLAKLEWYREVLALEPNSKLFLPLARLLAKLGSEENNAEYMNEAFNVLRRGLDIHPDFMEARLFLIELLNMCGCKAQCGAEVARLASLFLSYPDFWDAWREYAVTENESSDFTVALGFMSAIMRNKSLSIVHVLEAGLNALKTSSSPVFSADTLKLAKDIEKSGMAKMPAQGMADIETCLHNVAGQSLAGSENSENAAGEDLAAEEHGSEEYAAEETEDLPEADMGEPAAAENVQGVMQENAADDGLAEMLPKSHIENYTAFAEQQKILQQKTKSTKETLAELIKDANITVEPMENSPFRTRSMADLLAEQGDYKGALEIYQELLHKGYGNKAELEERIADIKMLAPELNVEIDKSKLLAIDDMVDTSFGLLAKSPSTLESAGSEEAEKTDFGLEVKDYTQTDVLHEEADTMPSAEENADAAQEGEIADLFGSELCEEQAGETVLPQDLDGLDDADSVSAAKLNENTAGEGKDFAFAEDIAENSGQTENISAGNEETEAAVPDLSDLSFDLDGIGEEAAQKGKNPAGSKAHSDVADLLTKLAERLEIRAN